MRIIKSISAINVT